MFTVSMIVITFLICILSFVLIRMFLQEEEKTAAGKMGFIFIGLIIILGLIYTFELSILWYSLLGLLFIVAIIILFVKDNAQLDTAKLDFKHDERDIMFSRKELAKGSARYTEYYKKNPKREILDDKFRKEAGLLSPDSLYYNEKAFQKARDLFRDVDKLKPQITGEISEKKILGTASEMSQLMKDLVLKAGGLKVGITACRDYHFYSHKGRGEEYGNEINNSHKFAIAFTVEMDHRNVASAPDASIVMESAQQYLNSGRIAVEIAEKIRTMGFGARAHIDGNYQVICPLVARDAGLGEIGRMGLLMTPEHGPRVRIAVVTTELELIEDSYQADASIIDFCMMCKKCADCCPSQSISFKDQEEKEGILRWKIDSESCFTFWCIAGTDCGRCMAVCPYSHPNHSLHKFIRWGLGRSKLFRYFAVKMDDFFYGRKPKPRQLPDWLTDKTE